MRRTRLLAASVVVLSLLVACQPTATPAAPAAAGSEAEQVAIYAAVVRQVYTRDDSFGGDLRAPVFYLVRQTDDGVGDPSLETAPSVTLPESVQAGIVTALADLPSRFTWVDSFDDVARDADTGAVADHGAIVTLGNVHLQDDGSALVSASIYVASLAASGQTYVLRQVDGAWTVTGNTGMQWMS